MRSHRWVGRAAIAVAAAGAVAALGAACAGLVLAVDYQPRSAGAGLPVPPPGVRRSNSWGDWHRAASAVFLASTIGVGAVVAWLSVPAGRSMPRRAVAVVCAVVAVVAAVVTSLSRGLVEWDQVGLRAVTAGSDMSGYWFAAFDDNVRFIAVGDGRVSQGQYVPPLIAHLAAPAVGAAALAMVGWTLFQSRRPVPVVRLAGG